MKKPLPAPLIHKTIEFAECVACVCPGIIILHCSKTDVEEIKATLDNAWHTDSGTIYSIPGTWKAYYFRKVNPYTIGFQTITIDASDFAEFLFRTGKSVPKDKTTSTFLTESPVLNYKEGRWLHVKYDDQCHLGVVRNVKHTENLLNVRCLKPHSDSWWKLEPEIDTVWYIESDIFGRAEHEPFLDRMGALYKLSKYSLNKTKQIWNFLTSSSIEIQICVTKTYFNKVFVLVLIYFHRLFVFSQV